MFPFFWLFIFCHTLVYLQCHFIFVFSPFLEKGVWDYNCDIGILIGYLLNISGGPVDRFDQWYPSENRVTLIQTWLIVRWASSVWCNKIDREWCYDAFLYATLEWIIVQMQNCSIKSLLLIYAYWFSILPIASIFFSSSFSEGLILESFDWPWNLMIIK